MKPFHFWRASRSNTRPGLFEGLLARARRQARTNTVAEGGEDDDRGESSGFSRGMVQEGLRRGGRAEPARLCRLEEEEALCSRAPDGRDHGHPSHSVLGVEDPSQVVGDGRGCSSLCDKT